MLGRLLGYYEVGGLNVIDGILRKAGGVLKTFPVSGGEVLDESRIVEDDLDTVLRLFRKMCNHQTKQEFDRLMRSSSGHIVLLAGGGSHDRVNADGSVEMHPFGRTTSEMIARDDPTIQVVPLFVDYGPGRQPRGLRRAAERARPRRRPRHRRGDRRDRQPPAPRGASRRTRTSRGSVAPIRYSATSS